MGAQIAAHLANAEVPVVLFDLPAKEGDPNGIVKRPSTASRNCSRRRWQPRIASPISTPPTTSSIWSNCGLRPDHRGHCREAWSGRTTSIARSRRSSRRTRSSPRTPRACRSTAWPKACRPAAPEFCGIHFFNPPRYMHLVELIATADEPPAAEQPRIVGRVASGQGRRARA